ncbi:MAG: hypothetical protein LKI24_02805 [Acidipropionibacterium sp.]|nr:hypothetical protein [Acidipropionibacterium sp.]
MTTPTDPTLSTPAADRIRESVAELEALPSVDEASLVDWVQRNPAQAYVLGLTVGIGQEKLKNQVNHWFGTGSWAKAAREHGPELIRHLDDDYGLLRLITVQRGRRYSFADVLIARAGTRVTATSAGRSGRRVEDELEKIAQELAAALRNARALRRTEWANGSRRPRCPRHGTRLRHCCGREGIRLHRLEAE